MDKTEKNKDGNCDFDRNQCVLVKHKVTSKCTSSQHTPQYKC